MPGSFCFRLAALLLLLCGSVALAQPAPLPPMDPAPVKAAIEKGVAYLKNSQNPKTGVWGPDANGRFAGGYTCLAGLTLIECGVPRDDPGLKKAVAAIRGTYTRIEGTYEAALAILFLDRMKEKQDKKAIEYLAARLIASQTTTGGWGYKLKKLAPGESDQIVSTLRKLNPPPPPVVASVWERPNRIGLCIKMNEETRTKVVADPPKIDPAKKKSVIPTNLLKYPVFASEDILARPEPGEKGSDPDNAGTDNSNVHFVILGLWAARRNDVPVDRTFALLTKRFLMSQNSDGSWAYRFYKGGNNGSGRGAMTSVGLLGLAIGHALGLDRDPNDPGGRQQLDRLVNGFVFLSLKVGEAVGNFDNRPTPKEKGGLYFFWIMERVAVLYDLPTLGNKDWYRWGAEILVAHQKPEGFWTDGGFHGESPVINTCMALMFLTRANLTNDIPRRTLVNADELARKVKSKLPGREVAPPPRAVGEPVAAALPEAPPEPEEKPTPAPKTAAPKAATTVAKAPPAPAAPAKPSEGGSSWMLIAAAVLGVLGLIGFLAYKRMSKQDDEDEDRPKKKKSKKGKPKVKAKSA